MSEELINGLEDLCGKYGNTSSYVDEDNKTIEILVVEGNRFVVITLHANNKISAQSVFSPHQVNTELNNPKSIDSLEEILKEVFNVAQNT